MKKYGIVTTNVLDGKAIHSWLFIETFVVVDVKLWDVLKNQRECLGLVPKND
jgi:hypothetical protein